MTGEESRFARGVAHFNAQEYFEAHEVWEELWLAAREPEKAFLQGLIQVAAAFHHHTRENARGARSLLAAGVAKLQGFPDDHRGIAVSDFRAEAKSWLEEIEAGSGVESRALPRIRVLDAPGRSEKWESEALRHACRKFRTVVDPRGCGRNRREILRLRSRARKNRGKTKDARELRSG